IRLVTFMTVVRAMDVGNPSNLARIIDLYGNSLERLRRDVQGVALSDHEIADAMRQVAAQAAIVLDPQSAAAYAAAKANIANGEKAIVMSGAHPSKFRNVVENVLGIKVSAGPAQHQHTKGRTATFPTPIIKIPPTIAALRRALEQ
ncbi:MAG: hypothetical protein K2O10_07880, partial [Muribaculaceae bacterium]|nr:hypothetical protein [Muribaculaceae bacterium]